MIEKLSIYDLMTSVLHGTIFLVAVLMLFPQIINILHPVEVPEILLSVIFVCITYFWGQVITSISSIMQSLLFLTWGGKPSERVFKGKFPQKYLSLDLINLAKKELQKTSDMELSDDTLFYKAMSIARKADGSLSERHNQKYAYNRVALCNILLIFGLFVISCFYGLCANINTGKFVITLVVFGLFLILHWYRAKQSAFYYVREVLVVAERELSRGV